MSVIGRLAIIGVGLIGGSLALALRRSGYCGEIVGAGRRSETLEKAVALGVVDRSTERPADAVAEADVVLLAVPLGAMRPVIGTIRKALRESCVLTDAGSAKASVVEDVRSVFGRIPHNFVPGHPIAGTEKSGVEAACADLFVGRRVILTPLAETSAAALEVVRHMWRSAGAEVVDMGVQHHDQVLAATSHLPHLLAFTLVHTLVEMDDRAEIFRFAAGGFRDFTRIASSDPVMWNDICLANREPLLAVLDRFKSDLGGLSASIREGDSRAVLDLFMRAKYARDNFYRE